MVVVVAAHGLPRIPGDAQDDEGDGEADVGVGAGVGAVGDQGRTVKAVTSAGTHERGDPVTGEPDRSRQREGAQVRDVLRMDEPRDGLVAGDVGADEDREHDREAGPALRAGATKRERDAERDGGGGVADVVDEVGEQRDRARGDEDEDLGDGGHADCRSAVGGSSTAAGGCTCSWWWRTAASSSAMWWSCRA